MTSELFPPETVQMDSPRLAWIKKHGVLTYHSMPGTDDALWFAGFQDWHEGLTGAEFMIAETSENGGINIGEGKTEDAAIVDLCTKCQVPLWNEEGEN